MVYYPKNQLLIIIFNIIFLFTAWSQPIVPQLNQHFTKYEIIELSSGNWLSTIRQSEEHPIHLQVKEWQLNLQKSQIISNNYICINEKGETFNNVKKGLIVPMNGTTQNGALVSLTVAPGFIEGFIQTQQTTFYIQPLSYFSKEDVYDKYVLYDVKDIIPGKEGTCGINDQHFNPHRQRENTSGQRGVLSGGCMEIEYAIASDYSMYSKYGGVSALEAANIAVVNDMQTNYDDEFNDELRFNIVQQFIVTTSGGDPWTSSTDPGTLLNSFTSWAPSGFSVTHDLGTLWSNRDFDGSTVGLAWVGAVCSSYQYNILQDFTTNSSYKRVLNAHEVGHNFDADHDASGSPYIMAPAVSSATDWSSASLSAINTYYAGTSCLGTCTPVTPEVNFLVDNASVTEYGETSGSQYCGSRYSIIRIPVKLSKSISSSAVFAVSASAGSATAGKDFELVTTSLTFPAGPAITMNVEVHLIDDAILESSETFQLSLAFVSGPAQVGNQGTCTVIINDGFDLVSDDCCSPERYDEYGSTYSNGSMILRGDYKDARTRVLYLPSHLSGAGISAEYITGLSFNISGKNSTQPYNNFRIGMANVSFSDLNNNPWVSTTTVYEANFTSSTGWNYFSFSQPFYWDGTSSLYIEFCFDNSTSSNVDYLNLVKPSGGGIYNEMYVSNGTGKNGCTLGSGDTYLYFPGNQDFQPKVRFYTYDGAKIENTLNKEAKSYIAAGQTAHFYSNDQKVIASVKNLGSTDLECTTAKVSTSGGNKVPLPFYSSKNYSQKTIQITSDQQAMYALTLYYTNTQMNTWGTNKDRLNIIKSNVPIASANAGNVEIIRPDTIFNNLGQDNAYAYRGVFTGNGYFALTEYNDILSIKQNSNIIFEEADKGILLANPSDDTYLIHVNNANQLIANTTASTNYVTDVTADTYYIDAAGQGLILKAPNNIYKKVTINNSGTLSITNAGTLPTTNTKQQSGNLRINTTNGAITLKSPDGTCWALFVNTSGQIRTVKVLCP